jgi:hypothetical protein
VRIGLVLVGVAILPAVTVVNARMVPSLPLAAPFAVDWVAARAWLLQGNSPYAAAVPTTVSAILARQPGGLAQDAGSLIYVGTLPATYLMLPLVLLPFEWARALWMTIIEAGAVAIAFFAMPFARWKPGPVTLLAWVILSLLFLPVVYAAVLGGMGLFAALLLVAGLWAVDREVDSVAGLCLGLAIVNPQVSALLVLFVLVWAVSVGRWTLIGWTVGSGLSILVGTSLMAPDWPLAWVRQVLYFHELLGPQLPFVAPMRVFQESSNVTILVLSAACFLYLIYEWILAWGKQTSWFLWTSALTLVLSQVVTSAFSVPDLIVVLPCLALIFSVGGERWKAMSGWVSAVGMVAFLAIPWGLILLGPRTVQAPLIMASVLLFMTLMGLWWIRYWAVRRPIFSL